MKTAISSTLCSFILIHLYNGAIGADIFLEVTYNKTYSKLYSESVNIVYKQGEHIKLTCSITANTKDENGNYPSLTWIEGKKKWSKPDIEGISIVDDKILEEADDGSELKCEATSKLNDRSWTISANFERKKTAQELRLAKPSIFRIVLICIGGAIGAAILFIILYRLIHCCMKRTPKADNTDLETQKVMYSAVDKTKKNTDKRISTPNDPLYTEIGIENKACHIQDTEAYVNIDTVDGPNDSQNKSPRIDIVGVESALQKILAQKKRLSLENNIETSDC